MHWFRPLLISTIYCSYIYKINYDMMIYNIFTIFLWCTAVGFYTCTARLRLLYLGLQKKLSLLFLFLLFKCSLASRGWPFTPCDQSIRYIAKQMCHMLLSVDCMLKIQFFQNLDVDVRCMVGTQDFCIVENI